jgi:single-strand DNA-binding protein
MRTFNRVQLLGYLGSDPQVKETEKTLVATFSVATTERNAAGEDVVEWNRVVAFGNLAGICRDHLKKGSPALVEGRLKTTAWEDEGVKRQKTEVIAEEVILLGPKPETPPEPSPEASADDPGPEKKAEPDSEKKPDLNKKDKPEPPASERQIAVIRKLAAQRDYTPEEIETLVREAKTQKLASKTIERLTKEKKK